MLFALASVGFFAISYYSTRVLLVLGSFVAVLIALSLAVVGLDDAFSYFRISTNWDVATSGRSKALMEMSHYIYHSPFVGFGVWFDECQRASPST